MTKQQILNTTQTSEDNDNKESILTNKEEITLGIDGKYQWPIRIFTPILFLSSVIVSTVAGFNRNAEVSQKFSLWVIPDGVFFIIWGFIYAFALIASVYNTFKNVWNLKTHIYFGLANILNTTWTFVYGVGTLTAVCIASFVLMGLAVCIYLTWLEIGKIPSDKFNFWTYFNRNAFAFYLGWCIAASNINFGIDVVYWWGATKEDQSIVFWVLTPLIATSLFGYILWRSGKQGFMSCFCIILSVGWAFIGAAIKNNRCL